MTLTKPICFYCSTKVKHVDREGVCTKCHKVDDEDNTHNICIYCDRAIRDGDGHYMDGEEGYSCDNCCGFCDDCGEYYYVDDISYCNGCDVSYCDSCRSVYQCDECSDYFCHNCMTSCKNKKCLLDTSNFCKPCFEKHKCEEKNTLKSA